VCVCLYVSELEFCVKSVVRVVICVSACVVYVFSFCLRLFVSNQCICSCLCRCVVFVNVSVFVCMFLFMCINVCMFVPTFVSVYVCMLL
jgi:hypothetical protein